MQRGKDTSVRVPGLFLVHHNLPGSVAASHAHPEHHLLIPLQGEISVELENRRLTCGPGRMIYVSPSTEHVFRSSKDKGERLICMIEPSVWKRAEAGEFPSGIPPANQLCKEILFYILITQATKNTPALVDTLVRTLAEVLSSSAMETATILEHAESKVQRPELRRAIDIARERFSESLSVADLARRCGMSERNLSRLMQVELGITPKQLLIALRIDKAKTLLRAGNLTVTETAFAVGYSSLSQFIASFRNLTGRLPSEFASPGTSG